MPEGSKFTIVGHTKKFCLQCHADFRNLIEEERSAVGIPKETLLVTELFPRGDEAG